MYNLENKLSEEEFKGHCKESTIWAISRHKVLKRHIVINGDGLALGIELTDGVMETYEKLAIETIDGWVGHGMFHTITNSDDPSEWETLIIFDKECETLWDEDTIGYDKSQYQFKIGESISIPLGEGYFIIR